MLLWSFFHNGVKQLLHGLYLVLCILHILSFISLKSLTVRRFLYRVKIDIFRTEIGVCRQILIVEDEVLLAKSLQEILEDSGHTVSSAYDGQEGLELARSDHFDLLILDLMLPKLNGFQVARTLRKERNGLPILMLTAKSDILDRVEGLDSGADYYLTKPFDKRELLACINALLRRQGKEVNQISFGNTALDLDSSELICGENTIRLSSKEFQMMKLLLSEGKNNITRNTFLEKIWGYESDATENNVEVYIGFLRKKLKSLSSDVSIVASRGLGYHLEEEKHD